MSLVSNIRPTSRIPLKYVGRHFPRVNTINHNTKHHPTLLSKTPYSKKSVVCKVALITGGVRGIGYNIAEGLLDVGTKAVIFGDAKTEDCKEAVCKLNEKYGEPRAFFQTCDISKKSDLEKLFKTVKEKFNKIDFVVNNADIDEEWDKTMYVNLNGLVRGTLLGFKYMGAQSGGKGGYIINVSSILGLQPFFASPIYSGTKHFGIGFSRSMGDKYFYDRSKVKVMTLCPSITNITKNRKDGLPEFKDLASDGARSIRRLTAQDPSEIGKGLLTMLEDAENGSVWVSEGKDFYKARIPDRKTLRLSSRPGGTAGDCGKENPCKVKVPKKKKDKCEKEVKKAPCDRDNPCKRQNNTCK